MFRKLLGLLSDSAIYGISSLMSQLIGFCLLPLYTRYLTVADYGVLAMLSVVGLLFGPVAQLGMTSAIFRRFSLQKDPQARAIVLSTGLASVVVSSSIVLLISCVFAAPIARIFVGDAGATNLLRLSLVTATIGWVGLLPQTVLRAERRVKTVAAINVCKLLVSVVCTICLVVYLELGIWGVIVVRCWEKSYSWRCSSPSRSARS